MAIFKQPAALRGTSIHNDKGDYIIFCLSTLELVT